MKEKIYTIPVNDAYQSGCACPLCRLEADVEKSTLEYFLGASLMEPDTRIATNQSGFCHEHFKKMYAAEINRLGLGLMLHTHMCQVKSDLSPSLCALAPNGRTLLKGRDGDYKKRLEDMANAFSQKVDSCIVCDKVEFTMARYLDVIFWMYFEDEAFKTAFSCVKAHCMKHMAFLLRGAAKHLSQNKAAVFVPDLVAAYQAGFDEMTEDVHRFTLKFDYRNKDMPWGNSKDAIPRSMDLLTGADR